MLKSDQDSADQALYYKAPCIGVCSTTYGDSVCRGCRRYSFEIIHWNQFTLLEKKMIWIRLEQSRVTLLRNVFIIIDQQRLDAALAEYKIPRIPGRSPYWAIYELIKKLATLSHTDTDSASGNSMHLTLTKLGLRYTHPNLQSHQRSWFQLYQDLKQQLYELAVAEYEHQHKSLLESHKCP